MIKKTFKFKGQQVAITRQLVIRTVGIFLMTFPTGVATAALAHINWVIGGFMVFGGSMITVITFLGVILAWNGRWSMRDIQEAFRTAASNASDNNEEINNALSQVKDKK